MNARLAALVVVIGVATGSAAQDAQPEDPPPDAASADSTPADTTSGPRMGLGAGPSSIEGQIAEDVRAREEVVGIGWLNDVMAPYFDLKKSIYEKIGFTFAADYTALFQVVTSSPGDNDAAGGMYRAFGSWELIDRGGDFQGSLFFKGEHRTELFTDLSPLELGLKAGSALPTGVPFTDVGWILSNLYWKQKITDRATLMFGQVDVTDYLDVYGLVSPWQAFTNLAFLTNPTIPAPNQGLGAALGIQLTDHFYAVGGFADPNADPEDPFTDFFDEGEYFTHGEIGWVSSPDRTYLDNIHVSGWHVDERDKLGIPDGWGISFSGSWFFDDRWMPFVRGGYADDGGAALEGHFALGVGTLLRKRDLAAIGFSWGRPNIDGADDQYTFELFYRIQLLPSFAITPDVQIIVEPPFNDDKDVIAVFGVRARLAF